MTAMPATIATTTQSYHSCYLSHPVLRNPHQVGKQRSMSWVLSQTWASSTGCMASRATLGR